MTSWLRVAKTETVQERPFRATNSGRRLWNNRFSLAPEALLKHDFRFTTAGAQCTFPGPLGPVLEAGRRAPPKQDFRFTINLAIWSTWPCPRRRKGGSPEAGLPVYCCYGIMVYLVLSWKLGGGAPLKQDFRFTMSAAHSSPDPAFRHLVWFPGASTLGSAKSFYMMRR